MGNPKLVRNVEGKTHKDAHPEQVVILPAGSMEYANALQERLALVVSQLQTERTAERLADASELLIALASASGVPEGELNYQRTKLVHAKGSYYEGYALREPDTHCGQCAQCACGTVAGES